MKSTSPFPQMQTRLGELRADLEEKREAAREKWTSFEKARDPVKEAAAAGKAPDKAQLAKADELHRTYKQADEQAQEAEEAFMSELTKMEGISPLGTGQRSAGIGKAFIQQLGGREQSAGKALADPSGGAVVGAFFTPDITDMPQRQLFVRSVIPVRRITSGMVEYLQQTTQEQNAAVVPAGDVKPTSVYTVKKITETVKTIAHVSEPVDRALLADNASLEQFLDGQLRTGVLIAEEDQIINGSGTGEDFTGILNTSGIGSYALSGGESSADALYKGISTVRMAFYEPDAIVLNPLDWQGIRLSKASGSGDYLAAPIVQSDPDRLWGKVILTSSVISEGTGLVGAFGIGAMIWDREDARVTFSESHDDLFVRNQVVFRGEERLAFGVLRAPAFAEVTGI